MKKGLSLLLRSFFSIDFLLYEAIKVGFLHTHNALFAVLEDLGIGQYASSRYCRSTGEYMSSRYAENKWLYRVR